MYFPQRLADTTNVCIASIQGTRENLVALLEQFKSKGFDLKTSDFYFSKLFDSGESDWGINVVFFLQNEQKEVFNSNHKLKSTCHKIRK